MENFIKKVEKTEKLFFEFNISCEEIAKEAQKYIDFDENVLCGYVEGDGLCLSVEVPFKYALGFNTCICPASIFFKYVENKTKITDNEFYNLCI